MAEVASASAATTIHEMPVMLVYSSGGACLRHVDLALLAVRWYDD